MNKEYNASSIEVLKNLEGLRKRPAMYIGGTDQNALHHLIEEAVSNCVDEFLNGHGNKIEVILHRDHSITVRDHGRGIPVDIIKETGKSALETVFTILHAGGKFGSSTSAYKTAGGLHGVGIKTITALSIQVIAKTIQNGTIYQQTYSKGTVTSPVTELGKTTEKGTKITFKPDPTIFETVIFDPKKIQNRLQELAFLNQGLTLSFKNELNNDKLVYCYENGIKELIAFHNKDHNTFHEILTVSGTSDNIIYDVAFQFNDLETQEVLSFTNSIRTPNHGTHVSGFKTAFTRSLKKFADEYQLVPKAVELQSSDLYEGLVAAISIKIPDPSFEGQTKGKLTNPYVETILSSKLTDEFERLFAAHGDDVKQIIKQVVLSAKAREAARKARESIKKKAAKKFETISKKLADCINSGPDAELFIVEGDSAGGSAKQGRDRNFQAILPIQGKVLNVEKNSVGKMTNHKELGAIVDAIGLDIDNINLEDLRYGKVVIMTDADVDGSHIQTLLLTFFFRHLQPLITSGHLYLAQPPLYGVKLSGHNKRIYFQSEKALSNRLVTECGPDTKLTLEGKDANRLVTNIFALHALRLHAKEQGLNLSQVLKTRNKDEVTIKNQIIKIPRITSLLDFISQPNLEIPIAIEVNYKNTKDSGLITLLELPAFIRGVWRSRIEITRYKGLGEMAPQELWETTMDPAVRTFKQVILKDLNRAEQTVELLMGKEVEPRRDFIMGNALRADVDV